MSVEQPWIDDREIVERIRCGDNEAEGEFVRRYRDSIRAMMMARTHCPEDAEDLAQDTMLAVLQSLRDGTVRAREQLRAFVYGTAKHVLDGFFRVRSRRPPHVPLPDGLAAPLVPPTFESEERLALALEAIRRETGLDGAILKMSLVEGLTPREISRALRMRADLVRAHKSRAAHRIASALGSPARPLHRRVA